MVQPMVTGAKSSLFLAAQLADSYRENDRLKAALRELINRCAVISANFAERWREPELEEAIKAAQDALAGHVR